MSEEFSVKIKGIEPFPSFLRCFLGMNKKVNED
jgi:hypothetical protein